MAGAAVAAFDRDGIRFQECFGYANLERGTRVTPDTLFRAASVSKMFTAVLVLQDAAAGRIDLDAPVNGVLDARAVVRNSSGAPDDRVTARNLLSHTSGLPVSWRGLVYPKHRLLNLVNNGLRPPRSEEDVVAGMRTVRAAGDRIVYANGGFALLGHLSAIVNAMPFADLVQERVLRPAGMTAASFSVRTSDPAISRPYGKALGGGAGRKPAPAGINFTGPAGALITTAPELAHFGRMLLRGGDLDGARLVEADLLGEAMRLCARNHPALGDGWGLGFQVSDFRGRRMVGHGGDLPGVATTMMVLPQDGVGAVVLSNGGDGSFVQRVRERVLLELLGLEAEAVPGSPAGVSPSAAAEWRSFTEKATGRYDVTDLVPNGPLAFMARRFLHVRIGHVSDDVLAAGGVGPEDVFLYPDGEPGHYRVAHPIANGARAVIDDRPDGMHLWASIVHAHKSR